MTTLTRTADQGTRVGLLDELRRALDRLAAGDLAARVDVPAVSGDGASAELLELASLLNGTIDALREREAVRSVFGQYVRPGVAEALLKGEVNLRGERREITVLISDVRGFTTLSGSLEPEILIGTLNRYFAHMVDAIVEFEGTLDKFLGDGLIVEFNAPISHDFHELRAVLTALRMRERLIAFNKDQVVRGEPEMHFGVGIHTGLAVVGNIGAEGRKLEYTAMGDTVNCASRAEGQTKEFKPYADIVITAGTYASVNEWVDVGEPVVIQVKGRHEPLVVYPVIGLKPGLELGPSLLDLARKRAGASGAESARHAAVSEHGRLLMEHEARVTSQRATLEAVMASMSDGLLVTDTVRQVRFCNDRAAAALGVTPGALIGRPAEAVFAPVQDALVAPDAVRLAWERALAAPEERPSFEVRLAGPRAPVYHAQVFPVLDTAAAGTRVGAGLILRDVTVLESENERKRVELERASRIQQRLLPTHIQGWPGVLEIAHRFRPAVETSGDFYDVISLAPTEGMALAPLQIAVGDVAGKGVAAALVTALARAVLRTTAFLPAASAVPSGTLRLAGQRLHRDVGVEHFVACALAVVEPPGLHNRGPLLRLANAAQVPVLLCRDDHVAEIEPPGYRLPLGAEADAPYRDAECALWPGDVVVFSSDGLVEAPSSESGELFGFARLAASVERAARSARGAEDVAAAIWEDLTTWSGPDSHHDDMTLLVLRVPAP